MAKTAKSNSDTKQGTKKISEKGPKQVKLQPSAHLRASGKVGPGLPPELFDDQLPEGVGPEYYNG